MATKRTPSRKPRVEQGRRPKKNPLITAGIETVDYKDVNLLRTFISDRGKIRSRRVTGLTPQQQRQVAVAVKNAREMALLPFTSTNR
ncbi:30S ribosomal protein S18 [Aldersonia sp. NBC_00410]|jgi:small subunit ribosomal protein S18|uniref:30S ribosomal protein S18 n=1 Tax=Aldersonia sp. NBC_00410 TaxID=2975954 RepID=UPI00225809DA|nr:30S ribosomal protein S18 [Aldersonia sp. NBC_00410]MCX5045576.1 30S ribosomal protein S18 [Aldersonia sp. NBC_00410]